MNTEIITQETKKNIKGVQYIITSVFNKKAKETAEVKLLRLLDNQVEAEVKSAAKAAYLAENQA